METKICRTCQEVKTLDRFYLHKQMADGHLNICKDCVKERIKKYYDFNKEKINKYDRIRGRTEERREKNRIRSLTRKSPRKKGDPVKIKARTELGNALRSGKIQSPSHCQDCGVECKPHGHHEDYSKPLDVVWLCSLCHGKRHRID